MSQYIPPWQQTVPNSAGEGTVTRRRRNPRMRVEDVAITEASGLALGKDGYSHPLEVTADGELAIMDRSVVFLLEAIYRELQLIREGLEDASLIPDLEEGDDES